MTDTVSSDALTVSPTEFRTLRVFALDLTADDLKAMDPGFLAPLLGADPFDPEKVEIVERKTLGDLGLTGYLRDGYGIPASEYADDAARLDSEGGIYALVPATAFMDTAQTLTPRAPAHLVGFYRETPAAPHEVMSPVASAEGVVPPVTTKPVPYEKRRGWPVILTGLAILLLILVLMLFL